MKSGLSFPTKVGTATRPTPALFYAREPSQPRGRYGGAGVGGRGVAPAYAPTGLTATSSACGGILGPRYTFSVSALPNPKPAPMIVRDLGRLSYLDALEIQKHTLDQVFNGAPDTLLSVEHDPVLTLGAAFHAENLLHPVDRYREMGIDVQPTDRGGDVTYHGPGQLVAYPIFDLNRHGRDLHRWLRELEEAVIIALQEFDIEGYRFPPHTGVWVREKKICAMGVKVKRWISMHGIALNCGNDLSPFDSIVPCGIRDYGVTSLSQEMGRNITPDDVKPVLTAAFEQVFTLRLA